MQRGTGTWVWDQQLINKMYNAIGCQDVLVGNDGLPVEGQLFPTAAHVQGGSFQSLHGQASDDGLSTHGWLQDVMVQQVCERGECLSELQKAAMKVLQLLGILFNGQGVLHKMQSFYIVLILIPQPVK